MSLQEPLRLEPLFFSKIWGGRALEPWFDGAVAAHAPVGEVWALVDRPEAGSRVAEGPYAGRSLRGLMMSEGADLLGEARPAEGGYFPILVKWLDATQNLSVQVHPDARTAERLGGGAASKTECWYVLSAAPKSRLYLGLQPGVDAASFAAHASSSEVVELLAVHPVRAGQFVFVPPGTVHAIGAGIALVEVQENSDTTYRLYDWGRVGDDGKPRQTHIEEGLVSIDYEREAKGPVDLRFEPRSGVNLCAKLTDCPHFGVELLSIDEPTSARTEGRPRVYVVCEGGGRLVLPGREGEWRIARGQTWLLPAAAGEHRFESPSGDLRLLAVETKA